MGGIRRRRERSLLDIYDFEGIENLSDLKRVQLIAVLDLLMLDNSVSRNRALIYATEAALRAKESGEFEERLTEIERTMNPRLRSGRRS